MNQANTPTTPSSPSRRPRRKRVRYDATNNRFDDCSRLNFIPFRPRLLMNRVVSTKTNCTTQEDVCVVLTSCSSTRSTTPSSARIQQRFMEAENQVNFTLPTSTAILLLLLMCLITTSTSLKTGTKCMNSTSPNSVTRRQLDCCVAIAHILLV